MNEIATLPENALELTGDEPQVISLSSLGALTRAEIDSQVATAKAYPRNLKSFQARAREMVTLDRETAESCYYVVPRAGKQITGPSVRLAEIVASAWGNLRYGARVVGDDGRLLTAQGFCHDLERNVASTQEVMRRITNKRGMRFNDDMVVTTANAACSIALRNAIYRVIPRSYVNPLVQEAMKVVAGDVKTLKERRVKMLAHFKSLGVEEARLFATVGKPGIDDIGIEEMAVLGGIANAIKDKVTTVEEAFPSPAAPPTEGSRMDQLAVRVAGNGHGQAPAASGEPEKPMRPVADLANPEVGDEMLTADQAASINEEVRRTGLATREVNKLLKEVGVKSVDALTGTQADILLARLRSLPDAREPGSDD